MGNSYAIKGTIVSSLGVKSRVKASAHFLKQKGRPYLSAERLSEESVWETIHPGFKAERTFFFFKFNDRVNMSSKVIFAYGVL